MATFSPAARVATVTPIPALPPPRITTSKLRVGIALSSLRAYCHRVAGAGVAGQPFANGRKSPSKPHAGPDATSHVFRATGVESWVAGTSPATGVWYVDHIGGMP